MSAEATKKATAATSEAIETIDEVFQEAMRSYEKALKSGIQLQEESVNLWKDLLTKLGSPAEFQAKLESMTADAFPMARQRMEEFVETFNRTSNQTIDLFEKTLGVYQATSVPDAQRRVQDLIESSLSTLRVNVHTALKTNAKIIASWKKLMDRIDVPIPSGQEFVFTADGKPVGSPSRTLHEFVSSLGSVSSGVLDGHARRGDFSHWIADAFHDRPLASDVRKVEERYSLGQVEGLRGELVKVIRDRYEFESELVL